MSTYVPTTDPWTLFQAVAPYTQRMLLHSEDPGTGKTTAAVMLAEAKQGVCVKVDLTETMTVGDLLGNWTMKDGTMHWHDGAAVRAIRQAIAGVNVVLLVNELGNAGPDVHHAFYGLLEDPRGKAAFLTLASGETLPIPANLQIIATMNPDPKDVLTPAELQRFQVVIPIGSHVSPALLAALPSNMRSMVKDGRMAAREAFALIELTSKGCDPFMAVQAVMGDERAADYGDALAIALAGGDMPETSSDDSDDSDSDDSDEPEDEEDDGYDEEV